MGSAFSLLLVMCNEKGEILENIVNTSVQINLVTLLYFQQLFKKCHFSKDYYLAGVMRNSSQFRNLLTVESIENLIKHMMPAKTTISHKQQQLMKKFCKYCGEIRCNVSHDILKLLDIWANKNEWFPLGHDIIVSKMQKSKRHTSKQKMRLVYMVNQAAKEVMVCLTHRKTWRTGSNTEKMTCKFMNTFAWKQHTTTPLPIDVWIIRSLWKNDISNLNEMIKALPPGLPYCLKERLCALEETLPHLQFVFEKHKSEKCGNKEKCIMCKLKETKKIGNLPLTQK